MSGMTTAALIATAAISAIGTGVSAYQASEQADAQKKAQNQAKAQADQQAKIADQNFNKANQKQPDTNAILAAASQSGKSGGSSTMLTGPQGVDPSKLSLGKTTLLGG